MKRLVIIGASGHGKVIADIALLLGYDQVDFLDDNSNKKKVGEYVVLGKSTLASQLASLGCDFIVGIGNAEIRERIQKEIEEDGCNIVTLIHPNAMIAHNAIIGKGSVVMAGAVINTGTVIGDGCIINTCCSVGQDNRIGNFSHISVGAHTAGEVLVGSRSWLGIGVIVTSNVSICDDCMLGAGTVVVNNICDSGTYVGAPAKKIK
ncbi:MAG: acetyltransferase [Pseudobutyrivibrio sp.]|uniref:acetyltransferase n=1 Tax=Pseudobutyrivibrio sp. TaxID=2014367 RepID=UPI0025E82BDC|nr:acetyltransferase [Pseudobutyrivibrio sp.]MBQ6464045.1 acetyltransferase [Pseudobutyrivibrio sp.]